MGTRKKSLTGPKLRRKPRKVHLTEKHRKAISRGLKRYWAEVRQKEAERAKKREEKRRERERTKKREEKRRERERAKRKPPKRKPPQPPKRKPPHPKRKETPVSIQGLRELGRDPSIHWTPEKIKDRLPVKQIADQLGISVRQVYTLLLSPDAA